MSWPAIKFVDAPAVGATVRLDMSSTTVWVAHDAFTLGAPSFSGDPGSTGVEYGYRQITFTAQFEGSKATALANLSLLAIELQRADNWLLFQLQSGSVPVWFKTYRTQPGELSLEAVKDESTGFVYDDRWEFTVTLDAEPRAYGAKETIGPISISNSTDVGTNLVPNPSFEVNTTGWTNFLNCSITRSTTDPAVGTASLQLTATAAGDMAASSTRAASGFAAVVGTAYTAQAMFRSAVTSRSCRVDIAWFTSGGTLISTSTGVSAADNNGGYTRAAITATAPATTAFAAVEVRVLAAAISEVHRVDAVMIQAGNTSDAYFDGANGGTWTGTANQSSSTRNPCRYVLPALKGDSPAPLTVDITPSVSWADLQPLMSVGQHYTAAPSPTVWQTASFTAGTDTTLSSADVTFTSGVKSVVSFATNATMVSRLTGVAPSTPAPGRYKVLVRMARSDTTSVFAAQLLQSYGLGTLAGNGVVARLDRAASVASGYSTLLDLGEFNFPFGGGGWTAADVGVAAAPTVEFQVQRVSGGGSAWLDYFVLIPVATTTLADSRLLKSLFRNTDLSSFRNGIWDGEAERFRSLNFGIQLNQQPPPETRGGYMVVDPSKVNVFHLHQGTDTITPVFGADNRDLISATASVIFTYYPRYLNLAAA